MPLVVLGAIVVGAGFYRGWFHLTSGTTADSPNVTVTVYKDKAALIEKYKTSWRVELTLRSHS